MTPHAISGISAVMLCAMLQAPASSAHEPCQSWQLVNPLVSSAHLYGAAFGADRWVAVGEDGTVMESPDRVSWTIAPPLTSETLRSVVWTGSRFVAVGGRGVALWSETALQWHHVDTQTGLELFDVAAGPHGIVAVGQGGVVATSVDGSSWSWSIPDPARTLNTVAWVGDQWVAAGDRILTSPDASQWTARQAPEGTYTGIAGNGSVIVATDWNEVVVSGDGVEWFKIGRALASFSDQRSKHDWPSDVTWCRSRFVRKEGTSIDGVIWRTSGREPLVGRLFSLTCGTGGMLGVGPGGGIAISDDDGEHWSAVTSSVPGELTSLAWDGSRLAATALQGVHAVMLSSTDGINWEVSDKTWEVEPTRVVAGAAGFVAFDHDSEYWLSRLFFSADGLSWEEVENGPLLTAMTWDGARFVALAWDREQIGISANGTEWWWSESGAQVSLWSVASNQETIVAVGGSGVVGITTDGSDWRQVDSGVEVPLSSVAWGAETFVAVGPGGAIVQSSDGETWQSRISGTGSDLRRVIWTGEHFAAVGSGGTLLTSSNGTAWQQVELGTDRDLFDISPNGSGLTVIGGYGLIMRSACVEAQEPPRAAFAWQPGQPRVDQPVWFTDLSQGAVSSRQWDFGDGGTASGASVTHSYLSDGAFDVALHVADDGESSSAAAEIVVRAPCGAPEAPELDAPESVASGSYYRVGWSDTGADWYLVEVSDSSLFWPDPDRYRVRASPALRHRWLESQEVFVRVRAENVCADGTHMSPWSEVRMVAVEPSFADPGDEVLVIPAAAHGQGVAKTNWRSNVVLHSPHHEPVRAVLFLLDGGGPDSAGPESLEVVLGGGQSRRLDDVVRSFVTQGDATGAILIGSSEPLIAASRTFNDQPGGTFGQFIAAVPLSTAIKSGEERRLIQLERSPASRTNIGYVNPGAQAITVRCELFSADGSSLGWRTEAVGPFDHVQIGDIFDKIGVEQVADAFAKVSSSTEGARFFVYASVVDNQTGDPVAMIAEATPPAWHLTSTKPLPGYRLASPNWIRMVYGNGLYVAVGQTGTASSSTGRDWLLAPLAQIEWLASVGFDGSRFVAVGSGAILTSTDGVTWDAVPWDAQLADVVWTGEQWVAVGYDGTAATSADGVSWALHEGDRVALRRVVWTGERLVAVGRRVIATSTDGVTWSYQATAFDLSDLAFDGTTFVAVGRAILTSDDGESWTRVAEELRPDTVVWTGDAFVAYDFVEGFVASESGARWQPLGVGERHEGIRSLMWDGSHVASIADDGTTLWLQRSATERIIPVTAHEQGNNSSSWRTDLELNNQTEEAIDCSIDLLRRGLNNSEPRSAMVSVAAGTSHREADVLEGLFGFAGVAGLRVGCSAPGFRLTSRTYTDSGEGTYGQYIPAHSGAQAVSHFDSAYLPQLAHSADLGIGFRTSLGLLSACAIPMRVDVELLDADGALIGTLSYELQPYQLLHRGNIFAKVTDEDVELATAVVTTPTVPCSFYAYASVIDNRTNDPIFVPAQSLGVATPQPLPTSLVFDNRVNALLADELPQAVAIDLLAEGSLTLSVNGAASLGRPDRPARVVCLYSGLGGGQRAESIGSGESVSDVAGPGPMRCFIPDIDECGNNSGDLELTFGGNGIRPGLMLSARDHCVCLSELEAAVSGQGSDRYVTVATGDLGAPERGVQLLVMYQELRTGLINSRILRANDRFEWITGGGPVLGIVLDSGAREDNSGVTQLLPY